MDVTSFMVIPSSIVQAIFIRFQIIKSQIFKRRNSFIASFISDENYLDLVISHKLKKIH